MLYKHRVGCLWNILVLIILFLMLVLLLLLLVAELRFWARHINRGDAAEIWADSRKIYLEA